MSEADKRAVAAAGFLCEYWLRWADDASADQSIASICDAVKAKGFAEAQSLLAFRLVRGRA
jgi:hypothetical protein